MAEIVNVNKRSVTLIGNHANARRLWIVDRVCRQIDNTDKFGFGDDDAIAVFERATFENIIAFLKMKKSEYTSLAAVILFFVGGDEIAVDAPPIVAPEWEKYFHRDGPRQVPLAKDVEVREMYEGLIGDVADLFPSTQVFSSDPPPRRSGGGFATARAASVSLKLDRKSTRHHHSSQIHRFYGRREGKGHLKSQGGLKPIYENMFLSDGIQFSRVALIGAIVRKSLFVDSVLGVDGCLPDPANIEGLRMKF